jgi:hypothetical protein
VLPTISYPTHVRGTFHGLSAACAKIGAVGECHKSNACLLFFIHKGLTFFDTAGTFMFKPISRVSFAVVLWVQVGFSLAGMFVAWKFQEDDRNPRTITLFDVQVVCSMQSPFSNLLCMAGRAEKSRRFWTTIASRLGCATARTMRFTDS